LGRNELVQAFGSWLSGLAVWDHFCTWTFASPVTVAGALSAARRHMEDLQVLSAHQNGLIQPVGAVVFTGQGGKGGLVHLHALTASTRLLRAFCGERLPPRTWGQQCCMVHAWRYGYARCLPYDRRRGAGYYVAKYVAKATGEWEFMGSLAS